MKPLMVAAEAPSNIALIKYMGKIPQTNDLNRPTNGSLSVTLPHLRTRVEIEQIGATQDNWAPLIAEGWLTPELSEKGRERFLSHFARLKSAWKISGFYQVRSASNFPSDCGLASSASSFAALTMAAEQLARRVSPSFDLTLDQVAEMSRQGSGSSIRSFYGPFSVWDLNGARELEIALPLNHEVIVVEDEKKTVSSSEAHLRVATSPLFTGRPERADLRLKDLTAKLEAVARGDRQAWAEAYRITWDEFHDMHSLFSTAAPPFVYMTEGTECVLEYLQSLWEERRDSPLVTMDAGANVHLLYRQDQSSLQNQIRTHFKDMGFKVFA